MTAARRMISGRVPTIIRSFNFPLSLNFAISFIFWLHVSLVFSRIFYILAIRVIRGDLLHFLEVSIRLVGVKNLIAVHHRDEVLSVAEVDDVVCIAWEHVDALNVVARDFKLDDFVGAEFALLNQSVATDHDEELPLGVVPMLAFGDARLGNVDAHLATV